MSLIFDAIKHDVPQTHVLIVGVSRYDHLAADAEITSAEISAAAFASWLLAKHRNDAAPLGSVALLVSSGTFQDGTAVQSVDQPSIDNIQIAFDLWRTLCDTNRDNVAIFYFCGHGIQAHSSLLLAADFELDDRKYCRGAIDADGTVAQMGHCQARTQVFLLDCCRNETGTRITFEPDNLGQILIPPQTGVPNWRDSVIVFAASKGRKAYGKVGEVSFFTSALIDCLDGFGADKREGDRWLMTAHSLGASMRIYRWLPMLPDEYELSFEVAAQTSTDLFGIIHETVPQEVLTYVSLHPAAALAKAYLSVDGRSGQISRERPQPKPWVLALDPGSYEFRASFPADFVDGRELLELRVPRHATLLTVRAKP